MNNMINKKGFIAEGIMVLLGAGIVLGSIFFAVNLDKNNQPVKSPLGAPLSALTRSVIPETGSRYYVGTSTATFLGGYLDELCLNGTCRTSWPVAGASADWDKQINFGVLTLSPTTTIPIWAKDAIYASSTLTVDSDITFNSLSNGGVLIAGGRNIIQSSSSPTVGYVTATTTTATSTFQGGVRANLGLQLANYTNCNLDTDANGFIQCGTDATGAGSTWTADNDANGYDLLNLNTITSTSSLTISGGLIISSNIYASSTLWNTGSLLINNASSTITNLTLLNATTTSATSTDFYVSRSLLAGGASSTIINLKSTTGVLTELTSTRSTSTSATSTELYVSSSLLVGGASSTVLNLSSNALTLGTPLTIANGGTGRSTFTVSQLLYGNGTLGLSSVATSSAACTSGVTCSAFDVVGSVSPSITLNVSNANNWLAIQSFSAGINVGSASSTITNLTTTEATSTNATTTNFYISGKANFNSATVVQRAYPSFTLSATTTAWDAGTTTVPLGLAYGIETWNGAKCQTDSGTLDVFFGDASTTPNRMGMFRASTTIGTVTLSTNNTFTAGETRFVEAGNVLGGAKKLSCTIDKSVNL